MTCDSSAKRFAHVVRALTLAGMPVVMRESISGELVTFETRNHVLIATLSRDVALQGGLLKPPRPTTRKKDRP